MHFSLLRCWPAALLLVTLAGGALSLAAEPKPKGESDPKAGSKGEPKAPTRRPFTLGGSSSGKARTTLFGIEAEGRNFLYVFDRSASMGNGPGSPLEAAKAELLKSIKDLGRLNQFQIIFYNDQPKIVDLSGRGIALTFADDRGQENARNFIASVEGGGGTDHELAIIKAVRLQPDVIFFLTDADDPGLSDKQLAYVTRINAGQAAIHTIQFGSGPGGDKENFLHRLSARNAGQTVYVDVKKLAR